jgi:hypothetical protein
MMSHPEFRQVFLAEHERQLEWDTRRAFMRKQRPSTSPRADVALLLRLCTVHDDESLMRLAALEGRPLPAGCFVIAEVGGKLVAAQPLDGGLPLADPFHPTAHLLPLLRLRARQIGSDTNRGGFLTRGWSAVRGF